MGLDHTMGNVGCCSMGFTMINLGTMRVLAGGGGTMAHMDDNSGGWSGGDNNDNGRHGTSGSTTEGLPGNGGIEAPSVRAPDCQQ